MKMDDLIYLIILIAWVAFAFYRQSQKKKAAQQAQAARPDTPKPEGSPFKTLEEILFEETEPEPEPAPEPSRYDRSFRRTTAYEPISLEQLYMKDEIQSLETLVPAGQEKVVKKETKEQILEEVEKRPARHPLLEDFDLRKAVLFAEILNKPYD